MAKKDKIKENKNAISEESAKLIEKSPYKNRTFDELLLMLEKKDELLSTYTADINDLRKQVEDKESENLRLQKQVKDCGVKYDEANDKSLEAIERYKTLESKFDSYKAKLDAEFEEQVTDLKNTHKEELEGQKAAVKLQLDEVKKDHEAEITSVKETCQNEIDEIKASMQDDLDEMKISLENDYQEKLDGVEKEHQSKINALNAKIKKLETLSIEGIFSEKLRKKFLDASKKAINEAFDRLAEEAEAEVSDKRKVEEAVNKANNRLKWLKEQKDHNDAETEELMSLLKELTGDAEA